MIAFYVFKFVANLSLILFIFFIKLQNILKVNLTLFV